MRQWGSLETYLDQHSALLSGQQSHQQSARRSEIEFLDYDWSLNQAR